MRPNYVSDLDIKKWSSELYNNKNIPSHLLKNKQLFETCLAGMWIAENLAKDLCPDSVIIRIQFTAAKLSVNNDPWVIHKMILDKYHSSDLIFEDDPNTILS